MPPHNFACKRGQVPPSPISPVLTGFSHISPKGVRYLRPHFTCFDRFFAYFPQRGQVPPSPPPSPFTPMAHKKGVCRRAHPEFRHAPSGIRLIIFIFITLHSAASRGPAFDPDSAAFSFCASVTCIQI